MRKLVACLFFILVSVADADTYTATCNNNSGSFSGAGGGGVSFDPVTGDMPAWHDAGAGHILAAPHLPTVTITSVIHSGFTTWTGSEPLTVGQSIAFVQAGVLFQAYMESTSNISGDYLWHYRAVSVGASTSLAWPSSAVASGATNTRYTAPIPFVNTTDFTLKMNVYDSNGNLKGTVTLLPGQTVNQVFQRDATDFSDWTVVTTYLAATYNSTLGGIQHSDNLTDSYTPPDTPQVLSNSLFTSYSQPSTGSTASTQLIAPQGAVVQNPTVSTPGDAIPPESTASKINQNLIWANTVTSLDSATYKEGVAAIVNQIADIPAAQVTVDMSGVESRLDTIHTDLSTSTVSETDFVGSSTVTIAADASLVTGLESVLPVAPSIVQPGTSSSFTFAFPVGTHSVSATIDFSKYSGPISLFRGIVLACIYILFFLFTLWAIRGAFAGR